MVHQKSTNSLKYNKMKKFILLIFFAIIGVTTWGQSVKTVPSYSEEYEQQTGILRSKQWVSTDKIRIEAYDDKGDYTLMIYRADSAKIYTQNSITKKWIAFPLSQIKDGSFMGGLLNIVNHSSERKFINEENVGSYSCLHYYVKSTTGHKGGATSNADWDEWVYEPYNMVIKKSDDLNPGGYLIRRNIKIGEPDPKLFELPKDYTGNNDLPIGGIMELLTGEKQGEQNAGETMEDKNEKMKSFLEQFEKAKNK